MLRGSKPLFDACQRNTFRKGERRLPPEARGDRLDRLAQPAGAFEPVRVRGDEVSDAELEQAPAACFAALAVAADERVRVEAHEGALRDELEDELRVALDAERALRVGEDDLEPRGPDRRRLLARHRDLVHEREPWAR